MSVIHEVHEVVGFTHCMENLNAFAITHAKVETSIDLKQRLNPTHSYFVEELI